MTDSVVRKAAQESLAAMQDILESAYHRCYPECCGRPGNECCGNPLQAWSPDDQHIMNTLGPVEKSLRAALAAPEPAEPQEQVWLSVESAPMSYRGEYPCYVLLWNGHHVGVGFCADSEDDEVSTRYYDESTEIIVPPPTHWMPLPAPPIAAGRASKEKEPAK